MVVADGVHGGYLAAVAIRAAEAVVGDRPIRTVTTIFLRPAVAGPADVRWRCFVGVEPITNLTVTLSQSSQVVVVSQLTAARAVESTAWEVIPELDLPPIDQCVPIAPPPDIRHFDHGVAMLDPAICRSATGHAPASPATCDPSNRVRSTPRGSAWRSTGFPRPRSRGSIRPPAGSASATPSTSIARSSQLADDEWLGGVFHADISADGIALEKGLITDPCGPRPGRVVPHPMDGDAPSLTARDTARHGE